MAKDAEPDDLSPKFRAVKKETCWAITWPGLGTFVIGVGETARKAYDSVESAKPAFYQCEFMRAL